MKIRLLSGAGLLSLALASLLPAAPTAPPIESLLPGTTREFIYLPSVSALKEGWNKTQFGKLFADPALKPYLDTLGPVVWLPGDVPARLGLSPTEIEAMAGGGAGWAYVQPGPGQGAQVLWVDTTGKAAERARWAAAVAARIAKAGGTVSEDKAGGSPAVVYETARGERVYSVVRDDLLLLCDNRDVLAGMLGRWTGGEGSLAQAPAFQAVRTRLGDGPADLRFFLDPLGRLEMILHSKPGPKGKGKDLVAELGKQGIDGIQGVGGSLRLAGGEHDVLFRLAIHAPPPRRGGLDILRFTAGDKFGPESWVPGELASFATLYLDLPAAFEALGPVFDQTAPGAQEGTFKELLDSLKNDPNGPRVDVRKDLVGRLGPRLILVNAPSDPQDPAGERLLMVLPAREPAELARTLRRMFEDDEATKRRNILGIEVWEIEAAARKRRPGQPPAPPSRTAVCVAHNCLFLSNKPALLEATLRRATKESALAAASDFQKVIAELEKLTPPGTKVSLREFSRPEEDYRAVYEQVRLKKLDQIDSLYGTVAALLIGKDPTSDLGKLPPFAKVAPYLKPTGLQGVVHDDGWEIVGFILK